MIYTKQMAEMAVIGLSLKWRQLCVCSLIDLGSRPMKSWKELWLLYNKQDACGGVYTGLKTQHQLYVGLWAFPRRAGLVIRIEIQYFNNSTLPKIMLFTLAEEKE